MCARSFHHTGCLYHHDNDDNGDDDNDDDDHNFDNDAESRALAMIMVERLPMCSGSYHDNDGDDNNDQDDNNDGDYNDDQQ